jgi:hypothetical protein
VSSPRPPYNAPSPGIDQVETERPPPPGYVRDKLVDQAAQKLLRAIGGRVAGNDQEAAQASEQISIIATVVGHRASFGEMMIGRAALLMSDGRESTALPREFTRTEEYLRGKIIELLPELLSDISICPDYPRGHA